MRKTPLVEGEYYHIYNRGVDKRPIFQDELDYKRFLDSMKEFNTVKPIGSIFENSFKKKEKSNPLIKLVAYCLNPNHYHLILSPLVEGGIQKFMQKLGNGYTKYFNEKHNRSGALFQGAFKSVHVESDEQLLYLSSYVNYNYVVHRLGHSMSKSSRDEYTGINHGPKLCDLSPLKSKLAEPKKYESYSMEVVTNIKEKREYERDFYEFKPLGHSMSK